MSASPNPKTLWKYWDIIEKKIRDETVWLKATISTFFQEEKSAPIGCRECFLRQIAILIISGRVRAKEITKNSSLKSFWIDKKIRRKNKHKKLHGSDWHQETINKIENHFQYLGYKVIQEPTLNQGRADLGVYKKGEPDLLIEVGTTSFYKLWRNLKTMQNCVYLIVPNDDKLIEFRVIKRGILA